MGISLIFTGRTNVGADKVCAVCKKEFWVSVTADWAYKRIDGERLKYYCSYKCMRTRYAEEDRKALENRMWLWPRDKQKRRLRDIKAMLAGDLEPDASKKELRREREDLEYWLSEKE